MKLPSDVLSALDAAGAVLLRTSNHYVFGLPNNHVVCLAATPSDWRASRNMIRDIRRAASQPLRVYDRKDKK